MKKFLEFLIVKLSSILRINLVQLAYRAVGIGLTYEIKKNGEAYFLKRALKKLINKDAPVVFDVGANVGEYIDAVLEAFPKAIIHAFEPNPAAFSALTENFGKNSQVILNNFGLSDRESEGTLYKSKDERASALASQYKEVFDLHKLSDIESCQVKFETLDRYVKTHHIHGIDLLKIDAEGNELNVLSGGNELIKKKEVHVIQFEFNEMNIVTRVFLRDFYSALKQYEFFRLKPRGLFPMGGYSSRNEIFVIQNIVAIRG